MKYSFYLLLFMFCFMFCFLWLPSRAQLPEADQFETMDGSLTVQPIQHGTLVLKRNDLSIYVDPVGGAEAFSELDSPDIILITHIHGDHLSVETLDALNTENAVIVVPQSVADRLPETYADKLQILANGESTEQSGLSIKAVAMYNLPPSDDAHHPKGRGNGYILSDGEGKVYISGDTEGTPEMRGLQNIDIAFICMNLPYTMDVEQAADAVLAFKPAIVYPYHYRGQDVEKFKQLVNAKNNQIDVRLLEWYN